MNVLQKSWKGSLSRIVCCVALGVGADAMGAEPPLQPPAPATSQEKPSPKVLAEQHLPTAPGKAPANNAPQGKSEKPGTPFAAFPGASPAGGAPTKAEPVKLKVFRLKHNDPEAVMNTAQLLLDGQGVGFGGIGGGIGGIGGLNGIGGGIGGIGGIQGGIGGIGGIGGLGIAGGGQLGMIGGVGIAGGGQLGAIGGAGLAGGFGGGPMAGALGGGGLQGAFGMGGAVGATRFVVDARTRTLLARGPERELEIVADLVALIDTTPGKPAPKVKSLHVFKLKYADPDEVASAVGQLGIEARIVPLVMAVMDLDEQQRLVVARGTDEQISEIRQVIEAMDLRVEDTGEGAPQKAPPAPKRNRGGGKRGKQPPNPGNAK